MGFWFAPISPLVEMLVIEEVMVEEAVVVVAVIIGFDAVVDDDDETLEINGDDDDDDDDVVEVVDVDSITSMAITGSDTDASGFESTMMNNVAGVAVMTGAVEIVEEEVEMEVVEEVEETDGFFNWMGTMTLR